MPTAFRELLSQASARGARSTALHSLQWGLGILLFGVSLSLWAGAPVWLLLIEGISFVLVLFTFLFSYLYLLMTDKDALRSETFTLSKMAIEKGLVGDNIVGLVAANIQPEGEALPISGNFALEDKKR